jgi:hypothetical protein
LAGRPGVFAGHPQHDIQGLHREDGEHGLHADPAAQYRNWFEPRGAVQLLRLLSDRSPLRPEHTRLLLDWLRETPTDARRLKAGLPPTWA